MSVSIELLLQCTTMVNSKFPVIIYIELCNLITSERVYYETECAQWTLDTSDPLQTVFSDTISIAS